MPGSKLRGRLGNAVRERLYANAQVRYETFDDLDRSGSMARGVDERLGIGADRQHHDVPMGARERGPGSRVMGVVRIEERDDDAGVENDYRHSPRSLWSEACG